MTPPEPSPQEPIEREASVMPAVAPSRAGIPVWVVPVLLAFAGLLLFLVLDARRRSLTAPAVRPRDDDVALPTSQPPSLYIPPEPLPSAMPLPALLPPPPASAPTPVVVVRPAPTPTPQPSQQVQVVQREAPAQPRRIPTEPALVIDTTTADAPAGTSAAGAPATQDNRRGGSGASLAGARAGAGMLANRATTVPQGTIIPAVLETALDSTRPGLARAIVSHDVRGFDGTRILVPRGSRLIGEYDAETKSGQNRMLVNWIRLIRPDGATIAIESPAADTVGRAGVKASVNSHFFERFAGAILQSSLDIGVNLASRSVRSPVVLAYPGSLSATPQITNQTNIQPTLKVKPATTISIFVARDLDFTGVDNP